MGLGVRGDAVVTLDRSEPGVVAGESKLDRVAGEAFVGGDGGEQLAHERGLATGPAYSAAKAGVNSFTEMLNATERMHGIRSCAVCPGEVATPILEQRPHPPSARARALMLQPEDLAEALLLVVALPQRAAVELLTITPTVQRDLAAEME